MFHLTPLPVTVATSSFKKHPRPVTNAWPGHQKRWLELGITATVSDQPAELQRVATSRHRLQSGRIRLYHEQDDVKHLKKHMAKIAKGDIEAITNEKIK